jgi:hypothetical protein
MLRLFNFQLNAEKKDYLNYLGYSEKTGYVFVVIFSFLSIIMNMIFIINYFLKKLFNKKIKKVSSLEQILFILAILESIVSLLWFISAIKYPKRQKMQNDSEEVCLGCKIVGSLLTFFYIFDWLLSGFALYHLKSMIINPINFILKPFKKIMLYSIISAFAALVITVPSYFYKMIGISPMISCFFSLNNNNTTEKVFIIIFIFIPVYNLIFFFTEVIIVVTNPSYKTDSENRTLFKNHCIYTLINHLMNLLMSTLYIIYWVKGNEGVKNEAVSWYFYLVTLMICFNPLLVGLIRLYQTGILKMICYKHKKKSVEGPLLDKENENELNIENFEADAVKKFVMNIYISVCYCLEKSVKLHNNESKIDENLCKQTNEYTISKSEINKDLSIVHLPKDVFVKSREDFSISCVEYAPQIFAYLRRLDMIKEEEIIQSLLPKNNKNGIQDSEGRGGSFFLNTDDNEFVLKTITFGEAELIRSVLLCRMAEYLSSNKDSIIGRIYGVYKISMKTGLFKEDEIYFLLMKNVIASFAVENLICKYDLKGSSLNRKVNLGEFVTNVMKDNNFREVEQVLLLNKENSQKLLKVASEDANFFCKVKVMDYSLLVAKIALNNDEIEDLFGKYHRRRSEIEYFEMAGIKRDSLNDVTLNVKENEENEKMIEEYHKNKDKEEANKKIRYKRDKIKPLKKYFYPSLKGDVLYIIAIIDFFQLYNLQKTLETQMKLLKKGVRKKDISSMPPEGYKDRFIEFVKSITDSEKYVKEINDPENKNDFM